MARLKRAPSPLVLRICWRMCRSDRLRSAWGDRRSIDGRGQVLPPLQDGALRIRSEYMAAGYVGDPEATQMFFRDGYFYSGDVGHVTPDRILGRHRARENRTERWRRYDTPGNSRRSDSVIRGGTRGRRIRAQQRSRDFRTLRRDRHNRAESRTPRCEIIAQIDFRHPAFRCNSSLLMHCRAAGKESWSDNVLQEVVAANDKRCLRRNEHRRSHSVSMPTPASGSRNLRARSGHRSYQLSAA